MYGIQHVRNRWIIEREGRNLNEEEGATQY